MNSLNKTVNINDIDDINDIELGKIYGSGDTPESSITNIANTTIFDPTNSTDSDLSQSIITVEPATNIADTLENDVMTAKDKTTAKTLLKAIKKEVANIQSDSEIQNLIKNNNQEDLVINPKIQQLKCQIQELHGLIKNAKPPKQKGIKSYLRPILPYALIAGATVAEGLNKTQFNASNLGSLGVKLWLYGLLFHTTREFLKPATGISRPLIQASIAGVGAGAQILGNYVTSGDRTPSVFGSIFAISLGVAACFAGKDLRNIILPKEKAIHTVEDDEALSLAISLADTNSPLLLAMNKQKTQMVVQGTPASYISYIANAAIVAGLVLTQSYVNKLIGNTLVLGSKVTNNGLPLIVDYLFFCFLSNLVKGNLKQVDSYTKHYGALGTFVSGAVVSDYMINQQIGETSMLAGITALGYLNKGICYTINGLKPFGINQTKPKLSLKETEEKMKNSTLWNTLMSAAATTVNLVTETGDPINTLTNQTFSGSNRKGVKADIKLVTQKTTDGTRICETLPQRLWAVTYRALKGMASSGIASGVYYGIQKAGVKVPGASNSTWSALASAGAVSAIIATNYFTDALIRAKATPKEEKN